MTGNLHSIQTLGALDGPGLRTVVFLQGCRMHCKFCHSVDTTTREGGTQITTEELFEKVIRNKPYWGTESDVHGGVTISGGDPLNQPHFLLEFVKMLKKEGVHVTVETSMFGERELIDELTELVDLWMVSIKHSDPAQHLWLTGRESAQILENLKYTDEKISAKEKGAKIRIRYVVIPGISDQLVAVNGLCSIVKHIRNLEQVELLPYVSMGSYKWVELFGKYDLVGVRDADQNDLQRVSEVLGRAGVRIYGV